MATTKKKKQSNTKDHNDNREISTPFARKDVSEHYKGESARIPSWSDGEELTEEEAQNNKYDEDSFREQIKVHEEGIEKIKERRREEYRVKRDKNREWVELGANNLFFKVQPYELHGDEQILKANYSQVNFRVAPEKRDWASTYMDELLNTIDKELLQEGYNKVGGRGKKSKGSDFVLNAFMDMFIVLQEDQETLKIAPGFHDWLECLRAYLKVRRRNMNFQK